MVHGCPGHLGAPATVPSSLQLIEQGHARRQITMVALPYVHSMAKESKKKCAVLVSTSIA